MTRIVPLLLLIVLYWCSYTNAVKVCDDFQYYVKPDRRHCHNNPDGERNITEIIRAWAGVTVEEHYIYTEDGYQILLIQAYATKKRDPIVLGNGDFAKTLGWVNRRDKSLAQFLISKGHEVWIVNFRGGIYSRGHKTLRADQDAYWKFSFHEIGIYDLDVSLQFIKNKCGKKAIYIGHSTGSTVGYVYGIKRTVSAKNTLKGMISLAPVAYLHDIKSSFQISLAWANYFKPLIYKKTHGEFIVEWIINCSSIFDMYLGEIGKSTLYGDNFDQIDPLYLPLIHNQNQPHSVGVEVLVHLYQIMRSRKFQEKDFGKRNNLKIYGQETPELYNISEIPVPVSLFLGENDWIAMKKNAWLFYDQLTPSKQCGVTTVEDEKWNHINFIEAKDVKEILYESLYKAVSSLCHGVCLNQK